VSNHRAWACAAALSIKQAIEKLNEQVNGLGCAPLKVQIGLHSGTVLAGNIGSDKFMKFGCLGDAVNLASRLSGVCNIFGVPIVASSATVDELLESNVFFTRKLARVTVVGRREPTEIYELLGRERSDFVESAAATPVVFQDEAILPTPKSRPEGSTPWRTTTGTSGPMGANGPKQAVGLLRSCAPCGAAKKGGATSPTAWALEATVPGLMDCVRETGAVGGRQAREASPAAAERRIECEDAVSPATRQSAKEYEQALEAYVHHNFEDALTLAAKLAEEGDVPARRLMERIGEVEQEERNTPEEHSPPWTGDWPLKKK
jgi:hypothetical protein